MKVTVIKKAKATATATKTPQYLIARHTELAARIKELETEKEEIRSEVRTRMDAGEKIADETGEFRLIPNTKLDWSVADIRVIIKEDTDSYLKANVDMLKARIKVGDSTAKKLELTATAERRTDLKFFPA